jgi:hypothetical protein
MQLPARITYGQVHPRAVPGAYFVGMKPQVQMNALFSPFQTIEDIQSLIRSKVM